MALTPVAVQYIERHRADSSDEDIARALREQGFSDETLAAAFRAAGERPASAPPVKRRFARRALVVILAAVAVLFSVASALLFIRNLRQVIGQ